MQSAGYSNLLFPLQICHILLIQPLSLLKMESVAVSIQNVINTANHARADQMDVDYFASDTPNCNLNCPKPSDAKQVAHHQ